MEPEVLSIRIDNKKMWAALSLVIPVSTDSFFTVEYVENYLYEHGVIAGLKKDAIAAFVESPTVGQEVVVAEAVQPVKGDEGYFVYKVDVKDEKSKPVILEDGSVDYYNSLALAMVNVGDYIAEYIPATEGVEGYNIFDEPLPARRGRDLPKLKGKGFTISEDGRNYYASTYGRIYTLNEKLIVDEVYIVNGDLGIEQGNIHFNGDVEIKGDVRSGLEIITDGSIFIHGHVGGCKLQAGKNITIRKGVQGREKCLITAGNDIACSFVERSVIRAGRNVYADSIMTSEVYARNQVVVSSKRGLILGGTTLGSRGVIAKTAGNQVGVNTILQSGFSEEVIARAGELVEAHYKVKAEVELLDRNMLVYNAVPEEQRTEEMESTRKKILQAKILKTTEQKQLEEQLEEVNEEMRLIREEGRVIIRDVVNAGVRINIGKSWLELKEAYKDVAFVQKMDYVDMLPGSDFKG